MTITVPGWAWWLLAALLAAAGVVVAFVTFGRLRRPGDSPDPYQDVPALYMETSRQELEQAARTDLEAQEHQDEVATILANPDPDTRTAELARLLDRWSP